MSGSQLDAEVWIMIGLVIGMTIIMILSLLAAEVGHQRHLRRLGDEVRTLRQDYARYMVTPQYADVEKEALKSAGGKGSGVSH